MQNFNCVPVSEIVLSRKRKFLTKVRKIDINCVCSLFHDTALRKLRGV